MVEEVNEMDSAVSSDIHCKTCLKLSQKTQGYKGFLRTKLSQVVASRDDDLKCNVIHKCPWSTARRCSQSNCSIHKPIHCSGNRNNSLRTETSRQMLTRRLPRLRLTLSWNFILCVFILVVSRCAMAVDVPRKVCHGTNYQLSISQDSLAARYLGYKLKYANCTYIDGNLEIVQITGSVKQLAALDWSFLSTIKEVTGYVLIVSFHGNTLPLTSLTVIRGNSLFTNHGNHYSLYVSRNRYLKQLGFKNLREIMNGNVRIGENSALCYVHNVNWGKILTNTDTEQKIDFGDGNNNCPPCHSSCRHCWGAGIEMCQQIIECAPQCNGHCYDTGVKDCCNTECAAGCSGPHSTDCIACKNFRNDNECQQSCPPPEIYDAKIYEYVHNPNAKFSYGSLCVSQCPGNYLQHKSACVKICPSGYQNKKGKCEVCTNCRAKTCNGTKLHNDPGANEDYWLHSRNIKSFQNCTTVQGSLIFGLFSFADDQHSNTTGITHDQLEMLSSIEEITGYLQIHDVPKDKPLTNFWFLRNLKRILGRSTEKPHLSQRKVALDIKTISQNLTSLGFQSLVQVDGGEVIIGGNPKLCYAYTVNWGSIAKHSFNVLQGNRPKQECVNDNKVCDAQCANGCWGPGSNMCVTCKNKAIYKEHQCVDICHPADKLYEAENNICKRCNPECKNNCTGPGNDKCDSCKHVRDGFRCKAECPKMKYQDTNHTCRECHKNCRNQIGQLGCTGPSQFLSEDGCTSCDIALYREGGETLECLPLKSTDCPRGWYIEPVKKIVNGTHITQKMAGRQICKKCHSECVACTGPGSTQCTECRHFEQHGTNIKVCVANCPSLYYEDQKNCFPCNTQCRKGCTGEKSSDCTFCSNVKVYLQPEEPVETDINGVEIQQKPRFNCTEKCPDGMDNLIEEETEDKYCGIKAEASVSVTKTEKIGIGVGSGVALFLLVIFVAVICYRRTKSKEKQLQLTSKMYGTDEGEPLTPTDAKPDLTTMRLIKESEIRRGGIIGSGAFGTVYKGVWIPEGENVKIPVAIKVLQEATSNQNKELLEEARVMFSVVHPCCVRVLAVCLTAQMMLVTQLMPLGCLLDYVRKNKNNIGSKALLNWCTQIAKGMGYLEDRGIVHRDMAARNVLVHSPGQVKITDFGLAKLLDYNQAEYHAAGGKMPIKWLALESIQHRLFTNKTDVWSYGITVWELFTYGRKPYENVRARDIPDLLEKGERLPQPAICTIDVYMIMIKCWMLDAESRPNFKELAEEFAKMARDPGRYLVIEGDKLMRLPSQTFDTKDLVRTMSIATEGPEEVMDAEDYLMPQSTTDNSDTDNIDGASETSSRDRMSRKPLLGRERYYSDRLRSDNSDDNEYPSTDRRRRDRKYGHLETAAGNCRDRGNSVTSRYSSDPCKLMNMKEREDGMGYDEEGIDFHDRRRVMYRCNSKGSRPPRIPVPITDEDDYLQPRSTLPATYIDVTDGPVDYEHNYSNTPPPSESNHSHGGVQLENPEYFDSVMDAKISRKPFSDQVVTYNRDNRNSTGNSDRISASSGSDHNRPRSPSDGESSPPPTYNDYYNDINMIMPNKNLHQQRERQNSLEKPPLKDVVFIEDGTATRV